MTELQLKNRVGIFLIISHVSIMILIIVLFLMGGFLFDEMQTSISLIAPMFAAYTTVIVKHIISTKNVKSKRSPAVNSMFIFISFLFPSIFIFLITGAIILKAMNVGFSTFDEFITVLALGETIFAIYIGQIVYSIFEKSQEAKNEKK